LLFLDRAGHRREMKVARPVPESKALESRGFEQSMVSETAPIEVNVCQQKRSDSEQFQTITGTVGIFMDSAIMTTR
jgi:hypothetical protein